jgi:phosphate transport system substrate-binding protein
MRHLSTIAVLAAFAFVLAGCAGTTETTTTQASTVTTTKTATSTAPASSNPFPVPSKSTQVSGSGATFPKPLLESWGITYAQQEHTVQVSYGGGGSGKGISDITAKNVVFGATDAPMSTTDKANAQKNGETILQFPETLGLQDLVYNVPGVPDHLKLDAETVAKIYLGAITKWNDNAIAALNPGVTLPANTIATVSRSDSSGTTFAFTDWLDHASPAWHNGPFPGASKKPAWTTQLSGNGNDGVGSLVKSTPNAIGYVELAYVRSLSLNSAMVKSHDGEFLSPTTEGAAKAASGFTSSLPAADGDWSKVSIVDAAGTGAWPISTFTYIMVYKDIGSYGGKATSDQLNAFKAWMWWCLHEGQGQSDALGYAPLPSSVVPIGEAALKSMH